jgi:hypothetical protein
MAMSGGVADKYGNRFEGRWTVHCFVELLRGVAVKIDLEPPGAAGEGVEFVLWKDGTAEHHQVKAGRSGGSWTIPRLAREKVLRAFGTKLQADPQCCCVLVTEAAADDLKELSVRALQSSSVADFDSRLTDKLRSVWERLRSEWLSMTDNEAVAAIARVRHLPWPEENLTTLLTAELESLVAGAPETTLSILAQYALDRLSGMVIATDIWGHLAELGIRPTSWAHDASVAQAISVLVERYIRLHRDDAILGSPLPREESDIVTNLLLDGGPSMVFVTGDGGMGKSGVLAEVVDRLRAHGNPVLPIRADILQPTQLTREVGEQVGLPGSPGAVLASQAGGRRSVLIIDQLDSVSFTSGRHPEFWHCLREVMDEARCQPEVSVLVACRRFELDNDDRMRAASTDATVIDVGSLSDATVDAVLSRLKLDPAGLQGSQRALLRVPLHLRLFTQVASEAGAHELTFESAKDLFDRFWKHKRERVAERLSPRTVQWGPAIEAACARMSQLEALSVPQSALDGFPEERDVLLSEHVLVEDHGRLAFFHQAFFDYAFARGFRGRDERLLDYLLTTDQGLFRRAQVRQVLVYERVDDWQRYLEDLASVLTDSRTRFHIKRTTLDLLRSLASPTADEWAIVARSEKTNPDVHRHVIDLIAGAPAWFDLADGNGMLPEWLASDDSDTVGDAVTILLRAQRSRGSQVARLLEPYVGMSAEWDRRLAAVMQWADLAADRSFFELFLRLLEAGTLDGARGPIAVNSDFWDLAYGLGEKQPEWGCEFVGAYLDRGLERAIKSGDANPFDGSPPSIPDTQHVNVVLDVALKSPTAFVARVLPFMLKVIDRTVNRADDPPRDDPVWRWRHTGDVHSLKSAILVAMENSIRRLAASDGSAFEALAADLGSRGSETLDFLVARGFLSAPATLADAAIHFLLASPGRLRLGYMSEQQWASRELLGWASRSCSDEVLQALLETVLTYNPVYEQSAEGRGWRGHSQCVLLGGIQSERLTPEASKRLKELERKFGAETITGPASIQTYIVGSPISQSKAEHMNDAQWLSAMTKYQSEWGDRTRGPDGGGAVELSRVLAELAKSDPERFVALMDTAPDDLNPEYFSAVVGAVGDPSSGADMPLVLAACRRADQLPSKPCGRAICRAAEQRAGAPLPVEVVEMVGRYALDDPDPDAETWEEIGSSGQPFFGGSVESAGINSNRGAAAQAIAAILFHGEDHVDVLRPVLERLVNDPITSVRSCVAACLIALLKHDRDVAIDLFLRLVDTREELLEIREVERFIYLTVLTDYKRLAPVIDRMVASANDDIATAGSRQGCLASLEVEAARRVRDACLNGRSALRAGAADIFAANLRGAGFRALCEDSLRQLFDDESDQVTTSAAGAFDSLDRAELAEFEKLALSFIESRAFEQNHYALLRALEKCEVALPVVTCRFAERFIAMAGATVGDIRTRHAADVGDVSELVVRVYSQASEPEIRESCLDLIDRMSAMQSYGLESALAAFERT